MFSCKYREILKNNYFEEHQRTATSVFMINTQQTFVFMKTSWKRLEEVFRLRLQQTFSRGLQDVLIKTKIFILLTRLQKTSSRCFYQDQYIPLGHTSSRRLQDVLQKRLQGIFKTSSRHFWDVFKTSSRHLQDVLLRRFQDVFKTSSRILCKSVFKTSCKDVFKTCSRRIIELTCSC